MLAENVSAQHAGAMVGPVLYQLALAKPKDAQLVLTVLKKLYPQVAQAGPGAAQAFANGLTITDLESKLAGRRWTPQVEADLHARGYSADTSHHSTYPAAIHRFLEFARAMGAAAPPPSTYLPEWDAFLAKALTLLPAGNGDLTLYLAAGITQVLGRYPIDADNLKKTASTVTNIRASMRRLARQASANGMTPQAFAERVLFGDQDDLADYATQTIYASYCRHLWNATVVAFPELDLPTWQDRRSRQGIPIAAWPESLRVGLTEAVLDRPRKRLSPASRKGYLDKLQTMVGILIRAGIDVERLLGDLAPRDAVRLLFGGWPLELLSGHPEEDAPITLYRRLLRDEALRASVLDYMRAQEGEPMSRKLTESPFITLILQERFEAGKYSSAESMVDRIHTINAEYLALGEGNISWVIDRLDQVKALMDDHPTAYDDRRKLIFRDRMIFERLIERLKVLFATLDERFKGKSKTPRWATHVRDLTYVSLVTLYPLRVQNHALMKVGENYDVVTHRIRFPRRDVKNRREIDFQLPESKGLAWVRPLVELYLQEARPILLRGSASVYFFVPDHGVSSAGAGLPRQAFNEILVGFHERHLEDVFPAELGPPNPHIFRHVAASYHILVRQDEEMAARLLNDGIVTIRKHYADLLSDSRVVCKEFFEDFQPVG